MDYVNTGGINVILSPGRYNAAFFEHSYLAEKTGAVLTTGREIVCENDRLYYIDYLGRKQRVGAVYRRISDEYLDPMTFYGESVIGIPHIFEAYKKGSVALLNAPGNGVADDKGIYYFVPKMIKYYLGEDAVLMNAPTYLHQSFVYDSAATQIHETAENALALGRGVCQDYTHIMLSLLREEGIPARYVVGMMIGEGASHAWVEALCNGCWYGFDPTNNKLVNDEYIRVSCGRDSSDCSVIRGKFYGYVTQRQTETVTVEEKEG